MLAAWSLAALGGAAALAGVARTPVQVGVTVTQPCEIVTPGSISVDAAGRPRVGAPGAGPVEPACGQAAPPQISVQTDPSKGYGYVVSISF